MTDEPGERAKQPEPGGTPGQERVGSPAGDTPVPDEPQSANRSGPPPSRPVSASRPAARPYGGKPAGPYRGASRSGAPPGQRPYGGKASGRPYGARPAGRPDERSNPRDDRPRGGGSRDDRPARHVEYSHHDRRPGPPPLRGPWARDAGPQRPRGESDRRGDWGRRDRPATTRPSMGPVPAEMLAEGEEIVAGRRPVEEAFAARREARRLLVVPERRAALDQLVLHATTLRIPVVEVEGGTITAISGFDGHQGIALVVSPRRWATLDEVLALARSRHEPPFLLALDHLEDPQNVGTLLRSAEACGVHGVIFPTRGAAPISPAAIKTSAGAVEHLLLVPLPDLAAGLVDLHARGVRVIGADGDAAMTVREADMRGPIVIVTGSEGRGLNAKVRKRVDLMARIPMRGKVASLNASVAGSIFLFEAAAQRGLPEAAETETAETEPAAQEPAETETISAVEEAAETPVPAAPEADDLLPEAPPAPRPGSSA